MTAQELQTDSFIEDKSQAISKIVEDIEQPLRALSELVFCVYHIIPGLNMTSETIIWLGKQAAKVYM